jgi:hypothetical protein
LDSRQLLHSIHDHYNKPPHIAMHSLQRFKNALQNINAATDICVGNPIRCELYEWQ